MSITQALAKYTIEPASCGEGFHIKYSGRVLRQDRKPLLFETVGQAEQYIQQQMELSKPVITSAEYQRCALSTLYPDLNLNQRLGLCALGVLGEVGEVIDLLKKFLYHRNGKPLDAEKLKDELGDVLWYVFILLDSVGLTFDQVMQANVDRLELRPVASSDDLIYKRQLESCGLELASGFGKVVDVLNQFLYYDALLDMDRLQDELEDVFFYLFILLDMLGLTFEDAMQANALKLEERHGNGFNPHYASDSHASEVTNG